MHPHSIIRLADKPSQINKTRSVHSLVLQLVVFAASIAFCTNTYAATYYVNCGASADGNGSLGTPWNSLLDANAHTFAAGDSLLFLRGATCTGALELHGSGSSSAPVTVGPYGSGNIFPIIDGAGAPYAIHLLNVQYWDLSALEITDNASVVAPRAGVRIDGEDAGQVLNHIHLIGLYIHDIKGGQDGEPTDPSEQDQGRSGGIRLEVKDTGSLPTPTTFNDILIDQCIIKNVSRKGFISYSNYATNKYDRPSSYTDNWPTAFTNVVIRRSYLSGIAEDGILPEHTLSAVVENNVLRGANLNDKGPSAGMWAFDANDTLFQFNEVSDLPFKNGDGTGYDEDYRQDHTVFQYNYSHNNAGGFMLNCSSCNQYNDSKFTPGTNGVVRYNISINDSKWATVSNMGGQSFYGNTLYLNAGAFATSGSAITFKDINGSNNIFYQENTPAATPSCDPGNCSYNLLYNATPIGSTDISSKPLFAAAGYIPTGVGNLFGYELTASSPGIGAGTIIAGSPSVDYFGNGISPTENPNMGAYDGSGGNNWNFLQNPGFEAASLGGWDIAGSASVSNAAPHTGAYALQLGATPSSGTYSLSGLSPNSTYTFSGWVEVTNPGDSVSISASSYDSMGSVVSSPVISTSYTPTSVTFTTGPSDTTAIVAVSKSVGGGTAYADDFVLHQEYAGNPGFESTLLAPWSVASGSAVVDTSSPYTGAYNLNLEDFTTVQQTLTNLQPYTEYTYSGFLKISTAGQAATLGVSAFDALGTAESQSITSTSYQYVADNFMTGAVNNSAIISVATAGSGGAHADDLSVNLNLVENPDFESGAAGAWQLLSGAVIAQGQAHSGSFALATKGATSTGKQMVCGLTPSTTYIASAWGRLGDSNERAHIAVQQFDSLTAWPQAQLTTSYAFYSIPFKTGVTNTCAIVDLYQVSGSGSAYLDDVSLVPAPTL